MIDTNSVMNDARCVESCIPVGFQLPVLISIFANIADMSLDPSALINGARCVQTCVPPGMQLPVLISLAQQILDNGGGGGGGGSGGNANVIPDGTDPNGTETALQGIRYDSLGNFWAKTNNVNNATGWEKFISAQSEMEPADVMARIASITVPAATLPESPVLPPVVIPESRRGAFRRFLEATKALLLSFFSFLPLILFLCVLKPLPSTAIPPSFLYQFCTTNPPTVLTNIIKSLATNTALNAGFWRTNPADGSITNINAQANKQVLIFPSGMIMFSGNLDMTGGQIQLDQPGSILFTQNSSLISEDPSGDLDIAPAGGGNNLVVSGGVVGTFFSGDGSLLTALNASALASGTVPAAQMPALTGDITTSAGTVATTLKNTGTAGTYALTTFDAQGRETSGSATLPIASIATPGTIVTQNNSFNLVLSNSPTIDAAHALSVFGGVSNLFDFNAISGLMIHLAGEDLTNYSVGDRVTNWLGYGLNATSTAAASPSKIISPYSSRPGLWYDKTNYLTFIPALAMNTNCTVFMVFEATNLWGLGNRYLMGGRTTHFQVGDGIDATMANKFTVWMNSQSGLYQGENYFAQLSPASTSTRYTMVGSLLFSSGTLTYPNLMMMGVNEFFSPLQFTNKTLDWPRIGICCIGANPSNPTDVNSGFQGTIYEVAIYTNALTVEQFNQVHGFLAQKHRAKTPSYLFADGDAGFIGGGMGTDEKQVTPVYHQLDNGFFTHNSSIAASSVRTLANIMDAATNLTSGSLSKAYSPIRADHLYLLYYGTHDIFNGTNAQALWNNTSNCMWSAKLQGWTVPVFTLLPSGSSSNDTARLQYNNLVRQNWQLVGTILCDLTTLPVTAATDFTNSLYYISDTVNGYNPSTFNSIQISKFIYSQLRNVCSTNLVLPRPIAGGAVGGGLDPLTGIGNILTNGETVATSFGAAVTLGSTTVTNGFCVTNAATKGFVFATNDSLSISNGSLGNEARITNGIFLAQIGSTSRPGFAFGADPGTGMYNPFNAQLWFATGSGVAGRFTSGGLGLPNTKVLFYNDTSFSTVQAGLYAANSGIVEVNNGTTANYRDLLARNLIATNTGSFSNGIIGYVAGSSAASGIVGEVISSLVASGSAVSLTTATAANVTSISLTAGDWDVSGNISFAGGTATYTGSAGSIGTTSATLATDGTEVNSGAQFTALSVTDGLTIPPIRINVSATTTTYLIGKANFSAGTISAYGTIRARRVR